MLNPKTIIELDYQLDKSQINELKKFLDKYFNIYDHEIKIYKVEDYAKQSLFAQSVFDEIQNELERESN
jgi:ribosomal protein S3